MKYTKQITLAMVVATLVLGFAHRAEAASSMTGSLRRTATAGALKNIRADHWSIAGNNIIVSGNVHIPFGEFDIYADKAVINAESRDLDAAGNIQLYRRVTENGRVTPAELARLEESQGATVKVNGIYTDQYGDQKIDVTVTSVNGKIKAQRFAGNLNTGYFHFSEAELSLGTVYCRASEGTRKPNGVIQVKNAEISSCNYLESQNSHYSISCKEAELTPRDLTSFDFQQAETDRDEYSIMAYNMTWNVYGIPVLWLPAFYKPRSETLGLAQVQTGRDGDWGYFISVSKKFTVLDYPYSTIRILTDYYQKRGFGYGARVESSMENSRTTIFGYGIYDNEPYESSEVQKYGIKIPSQRFDFRISNVTHITPQLDFRGTFEIMSDEYFNRDFFNNYYDTNPQPLTFAALERQFDFFSASVYVRPRVNDFFTAVDELPSGRIDIPRQELFGSNIYYQGEISMGYFQRQWQEYDERYYFRMPREYSTGRFDNLNMFYYPIKLDFLNIIPRAGFRMTAYTASSKEKIDQNALNMMLYSDQPDFNNRDDLPDLQLFNYTRNIRWGYDNKGGSKFRFAGEFGVEMNTKIYNSWQNVRSAFLQLDGLRHLAEPYINYTFIPKPTESADHLYYFDDIDRIQEQHFVRLGLINRLQTRRDNVITNYLRMENYWDFHIRKEEGFNHIGDFCTKLTVNPFKGLSISTFFSISAGGDDEIFGDNDRANKIAHDVYRNGRNVGNPGLDLKWLNRFNVSVRYEPVQDFVFNVRYDYQNRYRTQSVYSMGSSLSDIESGSAFNKLYLSQVQQVVFGMSIPLTPDRRTLGQYQIFYDFNAGFITNQRFAVVRKFHCWEIAAEFNIETENNDSEKETDYSFYVTAYLTGLITPLQNAQTTLLGESRKRVDEALARGGD